MRLLVVAVGSRGDVEPLAALGRGLAARGHEVRLLAHPEFAPVIEGGGVTHVHARGPNPRDLLEGEEWRALTRRVRSPRAYARGFAEVASPLVELGFEDTLAAAEGTDAILYLPIAFGGFNVAERLGIPALQLQLQPFVRTSAHPSVFVPVRTLGPVGNRVSHVASERLLSYALREPLNRARRTVLGLPPLRSGNPVGDRARLDAGRLLGFSRHVLPDGAAAADDGRTVTCGFWVDPPGSDVALPDGLEAFLRAGDGEHRPVVFFGLGSMVVDDPGALTATVCGAAADAGVRLVLQRGWGGFGDAAREAGVHVVDEAPHAALFPRVDAVVHHGGAGTTARGLLAGRPSLTIPVIADQFFWGHRLHAIGAGPAPLPVARLSRRRLASRLTALVGDARHARAAEAIGARLREEDGVGVAVSALERLLGARAR